MINVFINLESHLITVHLQARGIESEDLSDVLWRHQSNVSEAN